MRDAVRHSRARATVLLLVTTAASVLALLLPAALGRTLDLLMAGEDAAGPVTRWTAVCTALICGTVVLDAVRTVLTGTTDARATAWLRRLLAHRTLRIGPAAAARFTQGDLVTRGTVNAGHAGTAPAAVATAVAALLTPLGGIAALVLIDYRLALAFLAGAPVLFLLLRSFVRSTAKSVGDYQRVQGAMAGRLVEALAGARTVAAAGTELRERRRVLSTLPELSRHGYRIWHVQGRAAAQAAALVPLLLLTVVAVGGLLLGAGEISVGALLAAARYAALAAGVGAMVGHLSSLVRGRAAAARLADVLQVPPVRHGERTLPAGPGRLEFRGVTVRRGDREVLRALDLTVPGGSTVAVVGRSGSGKSVLAALAGRLEDPEEGQVLLDGVPLPDLDRETLRREIGYAFERPALLGSTIGGTIGFGPRPAGPERITAAARAACADGFIRTLPDGYRTRCAEAPLSGGEVQRLGLARAFAHPGRLLVLDDATSSLDTVTELRIGRALLSGTGARTRLLVAHRAGTAARADLVAWLDEGRIRALGRHDDLWERADYRAVWRT
ncbi:ABC transporter ATP-binding protein [Streptomyces sp. ACA25]|nr:ABC transporter ATP-binding protein [Streptomyces sp. ACA25]MDB1087788.1 ABC transporter ATP-binding protein [Streptomyces sp. ACA25]